ncbi:MAG TPA: DUF4974 domain-containing protein [Gemmatimonadaceae bacterium]|nr:DUF4974 domain-containing protein [Gemmatimonadaceae bacterium]
MPNNPHAPPTPADDAYTARLLAALDRHRAAERGAQARAGQTVGDEAAPDTSTTPGSPYLRLQRDLRAIRERQDETSDPSLDAVPGMTSTPSVSAVRPTDRGVLPFPRPRASRRWPMLPSAFQQLSPALAATLVVALLSAGTGLFAYDVYAAGIRARPATVTYTNAPLADVVAELRRRSGVDIRYCNVAPGRDRVTLTLADTPIDSVLHQIGRQNKLGVHWWWNPNTVLLQPRTEINEEHGWAYNAKVLLLSFTTLGCHPNADGA